MSRITHMNENDLFLIQNDVDFESALDMPNHVGLIIDNAYINAFPAEAVLRAEGHHIVSL